MKKTFLFALIFPFLGFAQDDLLSEIDSVPQNQKVESAFKSLKIVNLESTKLAAKGDFYFVNKNLGYCRKLSLPQTLIKCS